MSDAVQPRSLSEDIAFIRALVEEGRQTTYKGGVALAAGLIWGTASLYFWSVWTKLWTPPGGLAELNWIWLVAIVAFLIAGAPLGMFRRAENRTAAAAWGAVGAGCWTISFVIGIAAWRTHNWTMFFLLPPIIMALYGGAWLVCAAGLRRWWMTWVGVACLLSSLALAYTAAQPVQYLLFGLSLYAFAGLPGLIVVVRNRRQA